MHTAQPVRALMALLCIGVTLFACRGDGATEVTEEPETSAPPPLVVDGAREDLVFRFVSRDSGRVESATRVDEIPEAARSEVVVFDPLAPSPAGWEQVANLSGPLPVTSTPTRGYVLQPVAVSGGRLAAVPGGGAGAREVVMFSTQGCSYCTRARKFFQKEKVPFSEYDVGRDPTAQGRMEKLARAAGVPMAKLRGVPIIFVDGRPIVGFDKRQVESELRRPR